MEPMSFPMCIAAFECVWAMGSGSSWGWEIGTILPIQTVC